MYGKAGYRSHGAYGADGYAIAGYPSNISNIYSSTEGRGYFSALQSNKQLVLPPFSRKFQL